MISAYACEPGAGSEPGAGWAWARAAALAGHEVWLLTRENNRDVLDSTLEAEPELAITPVYLDLPPGWRRWKRRQRGVRLYYALWQQLARRRIRELHAAEQFDVAHHLTFAVDWLPAAAVGLPGLPAVWGPVGGAGSVPPALYRWLGARGAAQEVLREGLVRPLRRAFGDRNARRAELVIAQNDVVAVRFARANSRVIIEPNVALEVDSTHTPRVERQPGRRTAIFVGRLIPLKGLRLAVAAIGRLPSTWSLVVVGEGPERRHCQSFARKVAPSHRIEFRGHLPRHEVLAAMCEADVLLLPSMHDSAGWAVGEAAAAGIPTVCLRLGGPATMVHRSGGAAVPPIPDVVGALSTAVGRSVGMEVDRGAWTRDRLPGLADSWYRSATAPSNPGCAAS